ncbi:MAG: hypothetical protein KJO50_08615 [Bacteroidia bacterium]|nr:hypothetical protein [Bacteroidia bacterium]
MNQCYLPNNSSIDELEFTYSNELEKMHLFHSKVKDQISIILGQTYNLPDVLKAFKSFSEALAPLVNPPIDFKPGQVRDKDMTNKYDIYDKYFEVNRIENMTSGQFVQQYLDTSAEIIDELQYTSMSRGEVAYILKGWEAANQIILVGKTPSDDFKLDDVNRLSVPEDNEDRAIYRWKLAHHGFACFMIFSGHCFNKAVKGMQSGGNEAEIVDWLDKGAHLFRATGACMEFGNSFTATVYRSVIRPDMSKANDEANLPNGFSGTQNYEYIQWRKQKMALIQTAKKLKEEGQLSEAIQDKIELFRTYYLEDMHIHSIIAGRMVGMEKSLLQAGFMGGEKGKMIKITAGDVLRKMAFMREKEMGFLLS